MPSPMKLTITFVYVRIALLAGVCFFAAHARAGSPSGALRDYKQGKYEQALKEYEQLLEKNSEDPRLHYNAGAAAFRNRQFDEALKQFDQALSSPDLNL